MRRSATVVVIAAVALIGVCDRRSLRDHEPEAAPDSASAADHHRARGSPERGRDPARRGGRRHHALQRRAVLLHSLVLPELVDEPVRGEDEQPVVTAGSRRAEATFCGKATASAPTTASSATVLAGRIVVREVTTGAVSREIEGCLAHMALGFRESAHVGSQRHDLRRRRAGRDGGGPFVGAARRHPILFDSTC